MAQKVNPVSLRTARVQCVPNGANALFDYKQLLNPVLRGRNWHPGKVSFNAFPKRSVVKIYHTDIPFVYKPFIFRDPIDPPLREVFHFYRNQVTAAIQFILIKQYIAWQANGLLIADHALHWKPFFLYHKQRMLRRPDFGVLIEDAFSKVYKTPTILQFHKHRSVFADISFLMRYACKHLRKHNFKSTWYKILKEIKKRKRTIAGFRISIAGRPNGIEKARTRRMSYGRISASSFQARVEYIRGTVRIKAGSLGVKIWICRKRQSSSLEKKGDARMDKLRRLDQQKAANSLLTSNVTLLCQKQL